MPPTKKLVLYSENGIVEVDLETRHRILEAASELFTTKGFKGVSMRDVAEAVKVTPAALYYYFPQGKEDLFIEVIKQMFLRYAQEVSEAVKLGQDSRSKLRLLALQLLSRQSNDNSWPMLMRDVHEYLHKSKQPEVWQHYGLTYLRTIREIFQDGVDQGEISSAVSIDALSRMFHGMTFSFGWGPSRQECLQDPVEIGRAADTIVSVLFDGVALKAL